MKNKNRMIFFKTNVILAALIVPFCTIIILVAQSITKNENSEDVKVINVVKEYWRFVEDGHFKDAEALTTKEFNGLSVKIDNQISAERWLSNYKIEYIQATIHERSNENMCVVAVKVRREKREFYLFHDLVKNEQGDWKILSISY